MLTKKENDFQGKNNNFYQKELLTSQHFLWIINEKEDDLNEHYTIHWIEIN